MQVCDYGLCLWTMFTIYYYLRCLITIWLSAFILQVPIYCFHHNKRYFADPERFDPERFNEENRKNINQAHYVPFGIGPRSCIGKILD